MAGFVLETLSWKKLIALGVFLLLLLLSVFLIGVLVAPNPSNVMVVLGTKCLSKGSHMKQEWLIPFGGHEKCDSIKSVDDDRIWDEGISANQIVFSFWLTYMQDGKQLDFSRWQQMLLTVLQLDIKYDPKFPIGKDPTFYFDARIGYRNKEDGVNDWKELAHSLEERKLDCQIEPDKMVTGNQYNCSLLAFFELGSLHYDYYLVNVKVPVEPYKGINMEIGSLMDMWVIAIHLNGGFTKVWVSIKTAMLSIVLAVLIWFWRRIMMLTRPPNLLERTLFSLGIAMCLLNLPLEWLTLAVNMPFMLMINDIRQGIFYAMLLCFWIIFAGEHIMDQVERNRLKHYWKHLAAVIFGCSCLFIFELSERGVRLANPFFSIWITDVRTKLALSFIILAGIAACCYFLFLCYMIFLVFRNISSKRTTLSSMSSARPKFYLGVIYRFKFLMISTLLCAALTVCFFIISQLYEGQWKFMDEDLNLEYTSAFFTGVFGMWNVYVIGLLCMYAPSHKNKPMETDETSNEEEVQLTQLPSETSALQSFSTKAATDQSYLPYSMLGSILSDRNKYHKVYYKSIL